MVGSNIPGLYEPRGLVKSLGDLAGVAVILFLVKVFSEKAYADKFLRGEEGRCTLTGCLGSRGLKVAMEEEMNTRRRACFDLTI